MRRSPSSTTAHSTNAATVAVVGAMNSQPYSLIRVPLTAKYPQTAAASSISATSYHATGRSAAPSSPSPPACTARDRLRTGLTAKTTGRKQPRIRYR